MLKKIAFVFTHGIGTQTESQFSSRVVKIARPFSNAFREEFLNGFADGGAVQLDFISLHWDFNNLRQENLGFLQKYVTNSVMDPFAYQSKTNYGAVNKEIDEVFLQLRFSEYDHIVLIGHSWGGVVFSNFVWDCLNETSSGREIYDPSLKAKQFCQDGKVSLATLMSPIYLQSLKYGDDARPPDLPGGVLNLYSRYDPFSFPLTGPNYRKDNFQNIEIKTGPILGKTPFCHIRCFTPYIMNQVAEHVSDNLLRIK